MPDPDDVTIDDVSTSKVTTFTAQVAAYATRRATWIRWERQCTQTNELTSRTTLNLARAAAVRQRAELVHLQSVATRLGVHPPCLFGAPA